MSVFIYGSDLNTFHPEVTWYSTVSSTLSSPCCKNKVICSAAAGLKGSEVLSESQAQAGGLQDVSSLYRGVSLTAPESNSGYFAWRALHFSIFTTALTHAHIYSLTHTLHKSRRQTWLEGGRGQWRVGKGKGSSWRTIMSKLQWFICMKHVWEMVKGIVSC